MLKARVIPCLLLQGMGLVKSKCFENFKYVGDPINVVKIFNEKEVDELILLDINASKKSQGPNYELVSQIASEAFMPLCYGGGISSVDQAVKLINLGVEKVAINSSALRDRSLITAIATKVGSQSVVAAIDVKKDWLGRYRVFDSSSHKLTDLDPLDYVDQLTKAGAGEIFLNNVNADGLQNGYDLKLVGTIANAVDIPVIACGGAGKIDDFVAAIRHGASAVAAGSMFVFQGKHKAVLISYPSYFELEEALGSV
jgi:cyclase